MALVTDGLIAELLTGFRSDFKTAHDALNEKDVFNRLVTEIPSSTDANTYNWLGLWPEFKEWVKASPRVAGDIKTFAHKISNKKYESTLEIPAEDIEDDNIGYLRGMASSYVDAFLRWRMNELAQLLKNGTTSPCYDGQFFFSVKHSVYADRGGEGAATLQSNIVGDPEAKGAQWYLLDLSRPLRPFLFQTRRALRVAVRNNPKNSDVMFERDVIQWGIDFRGVMEYTLYQLASTSKEQLNKKHYEAARQQMREMRRDGMEPMDLRPTHLLVPPALEAAAKELIMAERLANGATNPNYNDVEVLVINRLAA